MSGVLVAGSKPVPATPPLQSAVAPYYERFDGLDEIGQTGDPSVVSVALGVSYGEQPDPGRLNAPFTPGRGIAGKVGSVGASPAPVATQWGPSAALRVPRETVHVSQLTTQLRMGPGGQAPGLAQTITMTEVQRNLPQPDDLSAIYLGG